jgi:hypothetical protein
MEADPMSGQFIALPKARIELIDVDPDFFVCVTERGATKTTTFDQLQFAIVFAEGERDRLCAETVVRI